MLKVLVAPLDWGLGHATRCIPIVKELLTQGCTVIIAASGAQKAIFQQEFPALIVVEIPGYRIKYGKNHAFTILKIITGIPKILIRIKAENRWIRRFSRSEHLDAVVSDNRYGLHADRIPSVFMTHQLGIRTGMGRMADGWLQRINYRLIGRFMACWVPDSAGPENLAGLLSHPRRMPPTCVKYIGWLSRLDPYGADVAIPAPPSSAIPIPPAPPIDLLILLSGPEPQRTILETLVLAQLAGLGLGRVVLIRGLPQGGSTPLPIHTAVEGYDHLDSAALGKLIASSKLVLSRPGYSTIMDLARLRKQAIFIPTPGQTEQEYLGRYIAEKGWAVCVGQRKFSLAAAFAAAEKLRGGPPITSTSKAEATRGETSSLLAAAVRDLLQQAAAIKAQS